MGVFIRLTGNGQIDMPNADFNHTVTAYRAALKGNATFDITDLNVVINPAHVVLLQETA
jgi:hypothetical protein